MKMADAGLWRSLLEAVHVIIHEAAFDADAEGIRLRAMDPSHIAMVDFQWPKTIFDEYQCDRPTKICININEIQKLLRRIRGKESLDISLDSRAARLKMILMGPGYTRSFTISTLEPMEEETPKPKISFNTNIKILVDALRKTIEDTSIITDVVNVEADEKGITFKGKGYLGTAETIFPQSSEIILRFDVKERSKASYGLPHLSEILKGGSGLSDIATWSYSTDQPLRLDFELPQGGTLQYYLAPRIEHT